MKTACFCWETMVPWILWGFGSSHLLSILLKWMLSSFDRWENRAGVRGRFQIELWIPSFLLEDFLGAVQIRELPGTFSLHMLISTHKCAHGCSKPVMNTNSTLLEMPPPILISCLINTWKGQYTLRLKMYLNPDFQYLQPLIGHRQVLI